MIGTAIANAMLGQRDRSLQAVTKLREVDPETPIEARQRSVNRWFINCDNAAELSDHLDKAWQAGMASA